MPEALAGLRVLDLTNATGQYCGKMFSDLGADVILVEPPGGSPARLQAPFLDDRVDPEFSLPFSYFNAGKRSMCLHLQSPEGRERLRQLIRASDVVLESAVPGEMAAMGLGYDALSILNPGLVMTSITPFGQTGPYAAYASDDIVALALGGMLHMGGYFDSPPIAAHGNQAWLAAAQFAAVATMMAVYEVKRNAGSPGRHIDVSIQECVVMGMENAIQFYDLEGIVRRREAGQQRWAGAGVFDCADGQIYLIAGGIVPEQFRQVTVRWLMEGGVEEAACMLDPQWAQEDFQMTPGAKEIFARCFGEFARNRTKAELYAEGQARRIPICPVNTPQDLMQNPQLRSREYFVPLPHAASGRSLQAPGAPYRLSETPWRGGAPAPLCGEHTDEVLREIDAMETSK
jgi:benzylsuccinate CoA-transferase BbsE subunit